VLSGCKRSIGCGRLCDRFLTFPLWGVILRTLASRISARPLVNDLPDAVAGLETGHEADSLRKAGAGVEGAEVDVDNDRPSPNTSAAFSLRDRPAAGVVGCQPCCRDLRSRAWLLVSKGSLTCW
jgi:hypothetical protein